MAATKLSITLPAKHVARVRKAVKSGAFTSNSEVIIDALRAWQDETEYLRKAWKDGIESGPSEPWNLREFLAEMHEKHAKKPKAKKAKR